MEKLMNKAHLNIHLSFKHEVYLKYMIQCFCCCCCYYHETFTSSLLETQKNTNSHHKADTSSHSHWKEGMALISMLKLL